MVLFEDQFSELNNQRSRSRARIHKHNHDTYIFGIICAFKIEERSPNRQKPAMRLYQPIFGIFVVWLMRLATVACIVCVCVCRRRRRCVYVLRPAVYVQMYIHVANVYIVAVPPGLNVYSIALHTLAPAKAGIKRRRRKKRILNVPNVNNSFCAPFNGELFAYMFTSITDAYNAE